MNRIEQLEKIIKENDHLYWDVGNPKISDYEYDQYVNELKQLDPNNILVKQVKYPSFVNGNGKVQHQKPMLSLDKVYNVDDLKKWINKKARNDQEIFLIQPKYDGISAKMQNYNACLPLDFSNSVLSTRGNGKIGENISNKLPIIRFVSNAIYAAELYGEILIDYNNFKNVFSKIVSPSTKKCYKNPRNATAGIMGTDDISFFKEQGAWLSFIDYNLHSFQVSKKDFFTQWQTIVSDIQKLPYPMDGIVIKIKDFEYGESLGITSHHPKNAIAFKFTNPKKETSMIDVQWSHGKNCLTPVAIFQPIDLDGITITRASLANYENLLKLQAFIGDSVVVERAGRVIPHIVQVNKNSDENARKSPFINVCPCCGSELKVVMPELVCPNNDCFAKKSRQLLFSVKTIGIENVGLPTIEKVMKNGNVHNLYDFIQLTSIDLYRCGIGEKMSRNIANEISHKNEIFDYQYLACLNIDGVGEEISKIILSHIQLTDLIVNKSVQKLIDVHGVGEIIANKIVNFFSNNYNYCVMLLSKFNIKKTNVISSKTICFTGAMEHPRKYYEQLSIAKGFTPVNTVNSKLTLLVAKDINDNSNKIKKAQKYNIPIISVDEFLI